MDRFPTEGKNVNQYWLVSTSELAAVPCCGQAKQLRSYQTQVYTGGFLTLSAASVQELLTETLSGCY